MLSVPLLFLSDCCYFALANFLEKKKLNWRYFLLCCWVFQEVFRWKFMIKENIFFTWRKRRLDYFHKLNWRFVLNVDFWNICGFLLRIFCAIIPHIGLKSLLLTYSNDLSTHTDTFTRTQINLCYIKPFPQTLTRFPIQRNGNKMEI